MLDHVGTSTLVTGLHARITKCHLVTLHWEVSSQVNKAYEASVALQIPGDMPIPSQNLLWILYSHSFSHLYQSHFGALWGGHVLQDPNPGVAFRCVTETRNGPASRCEVQQHWLRRRSKSPDLGKYSWPGRSHSWFPWFPYHSQMVLFMENSPGIIRKSSKKKWIWKFENME